MSLLKNIQRYKEIHGTAIPCSRIVRCCSCPFNDICVIFKRLDDLNMVDHHEFGIMMSYIVVSLLVKDE